MSAYSHILEIFRAFRELDQLAYRHPNGDLSYQSLFDSALLLAHNIRRQGSAPIVIYGHKDRRYLVAYWACILAGRALVPVEMDNSLSRMKKIVTQAGATLTLDTSHDGRAEQIGLPHLKVAISHPLHQDLRDAYMSKFEQNDTLISDESTMYIMFSSGSTGAPKGIAINYANVVDFIQWIQRDFPIEGAVSGNIRYCFDVSLYEIWLAWANLQPISALEHDELFNSRKYIEQHAKVEIRTWVSTPSLTSYYLKDPRFSAASLPHLNQFIFCGEVLSKEIVTALWDRFPNANITNTYGPTECTVAVTSLDISPEHVANEAPLPLGRCRENSEILIEEGTNEIIIKGRSVGNGYLGADPKQNSKFHLPNAPSERYYRTGDIGSKSQDLVHFQGRSDREVKVQGHRVDLNTVENVLLAIPGIQSAFVEPWVRKGQTQALRAFVKSSVPDGSMSSLPHAMMAHLPAYMVPKFWYDIETEIFNQNGKLDRRLVSEKALSTGGCFVYQYDSIDH
ncbi:AMP-binding protein [Vibrio splendidus]